MNTHNPCILNIAGTKSNEIYQVSVPLNLLSFCSYDFTRFMEDCNNLCHDCMKSGEYPIDEVTNLRNSISGCHKYYENNMKSLFDKIVVDCWIEYICRQGEMSNSTLWNSFIDCKNPFQRAVFQRLSEYRSHHSINQWVNLLKIQEYARKKVDYIFGCKLKGVDEAVGRLNVFDLMFSVAANEQGYSLENIGSVRVYKPGRLTNAPFVFSGAAKELVRNLFKNVHFADSLPYVSNEEGPMSDWEAMDSFAKIKGYIPDYSDNVVRTIIKSMVKLPAEVYMPTSFKAFIDLEIDALINSGGFLQRCKRCNEFYLRDDFYTSEYCDKLQKDGSTCREIMEETKLDPPTAEELELLNRKADELYGDMTAKLGQGVTQREFNEWLGYFNVIKSKVFNGEARPSDFDDFVSYSRQYSFPTAVNSIKTEEKQPEPAAAAETEEEKRAVKPYQFTRINRKDLEKSGLLKPNDKDEEKTAPIKQEAVAVPPAPQVARIIRGANPANFQDIPVRAIGEPPKQKQGTYTGEDFSEGNAESAGESAREAIRSITANAENKEPDAGKAPEVKTQEKKPEHFLPDLEQFEDPWEDDDEPDLFKQTAPQIKLSQFGTAEKSSDAVHENSSVLKNPRSEQTKKEEFPIDDRADVLELFNRSETGGDSVFGGTEKREFPSYWEETEALSGGNVSKISENMDALSGVNTSKISENTDALSGGNVLKATENTEKLRPGGYEAARSSYEAVKQIFSGESDSTNESLGAGQPKVSGASEQPYRPRRSNPYITPPKSDDQFIDISEKTVLKKAEPAKPPVEKMNRAARVVSAYRTVTDMPISEEEDNMSDSFSDFSKILDNIERSDGFEEEDLPVDADGVPVSHKTKHVMDAIMKNTGVSPSLIYGRRQAAEKNVVIDESFIDKKK